MTCVADCRRSTDVGYFMNRCMTISWPMRLQTWYNLSDYNYPCEKVLMHMRPMGQSRLIHRKVAHRSMSQSERASSTCQPFDDQCMCNILYKYIMCLRVYQDVLRCIPRRTAPWGFVYDPRQQAHSIGCCPHTGQFTAIGTIMKNINSWSLKKKLHYNITHTPILNELIDNNCKKYLIKIYYIPYYILIIISGNILWSIMLLLWCLTCLGSRV